MNCPTCHTKVQHLVVNEKYSVGDTRIIGKTYEYWYAYPCLDFIGKNYTEAVARLFGEENDGNKA